MITPAEVAEAVPTFAFVETLKRMFPACPQIPG